MIREYAITLQPTQNKNPMKNIICIMLSVLMLASCNRPQQADNQPNDSQTKEQTVSDTLSREQAVRDALGEYLVREIGAQYLQGEVCIPTLMIVAKEEADAAQTRIWGDFWVDWYNRSADTLKTVSGGNHSGCMTLSEQDGKLVVTSFEQTVDGAGNLPSAQRIFGQHFEAYQTMHSNEHLREAARADAIRDYAKHNGLEVRYYKDYGWPAKAVQAQ